MVWLVLGLALWIAAHTFKRWAPGLRASMGDPAKGLVAVGSLAGIVLMVIGYRQAELLQLWSFGDWAVHANNALMLAAVALLGVGNSKSRLRAHMRHPMLTGVVVFSVAHLLVNGDLPSLVLFGVLGLWALAEMQIINRSDPPPPPFTGGSLAGDIRLAIIAVVLFGVIGMIHGWLGPWPFGG